MLGKLAIVADGAGGDRLRIRVSGRRSDPSTNSKLSRVVREAIVAMPKDHTALLRMPLHWLCDGKVEPDGADGFRSDCAEGHTCVAGACASADVDVDALPDYSAAQVFGGGDAQERLDGARFL